MSWTFVACILVSFTWIGLFFLWGRAFLTIIHAEKDIASSVAFGYLVLQVIYHIIYLPFFLTRGSYRTVSYIWMGIVAFLSILLVLFLWNHSKGKAQMPKPGNKITVFISAALVLGLAIYISLHVPFYGADTQTYISRMNDAYYKDSMWIRWGSVSVHHGLCSMFHFFTMSSLLTGISPYYISLFTVRIIGICLFSMIMYRTGVIVFQKTGKKCWQAWMLSILAPVLLLFWGSNYTAEFFYWRINEAKGFCQFVLFPLSFSVFLSMYKEDTDREILWIEQVLVGLAAIPVSSSSMTPYIFLVFMGTCALLAYDRLQNCWISIGKAVVCIVPNLLYLVLYILEQKQIVVF